MSTSVRLSVFGFGWVLLWATLNGVVKVIEDTLAAIGRSKALPRHLVPPLPHFSPFPNSVSLNMALRQLSLWPDKSRDMLKEASQKCQNEAR